MTLARRVVLFSVLASWPMVSISQSYDPSRSQNLQNCLNGFSECNMKQLDSSQQQAVTQTLHDQISKIVTMASPIAIGLSSASRRVLWSRAQPEFKT
jgi:hypothetical protein